MRTALICLLFVIVPTTVFANALRKKSNERRCGRYKFLNETAAECQSCRLCEPGTYVKSRCKGNKDTQCESCPVGYYATTFSRYPGECRRCRDCGPRLVTSQCTSTSNTVCGGCPLGMYWDFVLNSCTQCSFCFPEFSTEMSIEEACQNPQIPSSHHCAKVTWTPYKPPYLLPKINDQGEKYFISSYKTEDSGYFPNLHHTSDSSNLNSDAAISTIETKKLRYQTTATNEPTTAAPFSNIFSTLSTTFESSKSRLNGLCSMNYMRISTFIACVSLVVACCALFIAYSKRNNSNNVNFSHKPLLESKI